MPPKNSIAAPESPDAAAPAESPALEAPAPEAPIAEPAPEARPFAEWAAALGTENWVLAGASTFARWDRDPSALLTAAEYAAGIAAFHSLEAC